MIRALLVAGLALLAPVGALACETPPPEPGSVPAAEPGELSLASLNLWRLRDSDRDARYDEPLPPERVEARLAAVAEHVAERLRHPHLLAVQEVENRALLERLARRIAETGPRYRVILEEGPDPSGIDVGLLVREPVRIERHRQLFRDRRHAGQPLFSRPPLYVQLDAPMGLELVVVHLRSARDLDEASVRARRREQARALRGWLEAGDGRRILVGDLNSAPGTGSFSAPWRVLGPGFGSVWDHVPEAQRFSYIHDCQRQAIDHILFNQAMAEQVVEGAVSRGNAGHYRLLYGAHGTADAISDHDSPVLYWRIPPEPE